MSNETNLQEQWGRFEGVVKTVWLDPSREMVLLEDFAYIDPTDVRWDAPKDSVIDGASIPPPFWSAIGSPYTGEYRQASVVHDVACDPRKPRRPWHLVHRMFYHAMRCGGVGEKKALIMYGAVYFFGPRWGLGKVSGKTDNAFAMVERPLAMAEDVEFLTKFVEEQQLTTPEDVEEWRPPHIAGRPNRPFGLPARGI